MTIFLFKILFKILLLLILLCFNPVEELKFISFENKGKLVININMGRKFDCEKNQKKLQHLFDGFS